MKEIQPWVLFYPEINKLLKEQNFTELKRVLREIHPIDLAEGWKNFTPQDQIILFRLLDTQRAVEVFEELDFPEQNYILNNLEDSSLETILTELPSDEKAHLFHRLPIRVVKKMFKLLGKEEEEEVKEMLKFSEGTVGSLMNTSFIDLKLELTARQALEKLQRQARIRKLENFYTLYVTNGEGKLIGGLTLRTLIGAPPDIQISEIMSPVQMIRVRPGTDQEEVAKLFRKYDLLSAPVVDSENRLIGVVTIDDMVEVMEKEATEDIYGFGKISHVHSAVEINYREASVLTLVRNRVVWLFVLLLIGAFVSGQLLKGYSAVLGSLIILAAFIPMLMDSGGNAGAQALAMVVRGLATGEVRVEELWRIVGKEIVTGFLVGTLMGGIACLIVFILQGNNLALASTVGLSLMVVITVSTAAGAFLPLIFRRLGFDPAVAASPFITTTVDAVTLIVYFEIAKRLVLR